MNDELDKIDEIMKKMILIALLALIAVGSAEAKKKTEGDPKIRFTEKRWDFGNIKDEKPVSHDFEFYNDGTGNLVILDATAECGCTRPEYPEKPIAPGKKGKIKITYNPIGRPGSFEKTVTIRTNGNPKKVRIKISGNVLPR